MPEVVARRCLALLALALIVVVQQLSSRRMRWSGLLIAVILHACGAGEINTRRKACL